MLAALASAFSFQVSCANSSLFANGLPIRLRARRGFAWADDLSAVVAPNDRRKKTDMPRASAKALSIAVCFVVRRDVRVNLPRAIYTQ
jgi:hypothetical protein